MSNILLSKWNKVTKAQRHKAAVRFTQGLRMKHDMSEKADYRRWKTKRNYELAEGGLLIVDSFSNH